MFGGWKGKQLFTLSKGKYTRQGTEEVLNNVMMWTASNGVCVNSFGVSLLN
jgi:hypothetical protein